MSDLDTFGFVSALKGTAPTFRRRQGTVVSVETGYTMTVELAGDTTNVAGVRYFGHYPPKVGAQVWIDTDGSDLICIGAVAGLGGAFPVARMVKTANQTLNTSGTSEKVTFGITDPNSFDPYGMYQNANERFVAPFDGVYLVTGHLTYAASATGFRDVQIRLNGSLYTLTREAATSANTPTYNCTAVVKMLKDEYVEIWGNQTSGGALAISPSNSTVGFGFQYLGPAA